MTQPPPQPTYILRGHTAQIHALCFLRQNTRLVTGDADGWVVVWSIATKRPVAVWRAHQGTLLTLQEWDGGQGLVTHGKDNKLIVWKLRLEDEEGMSLVLPADDPSTERRQPWLVHLLHVNTLNFCSFAMCRTHEVSSVANAQAASAAEDGVLIAVPNALTSEAVDIFHLPSERRIHTVLGDKAVNTGMAMALSILYKDDRLTLIVGYESGHAMVAQEIPHQGWQIMYLAQTHKQPILSVDVLEDKTAFFTSSADAVIAKHPVPAALGVTAAATTPSTGSHLGGPSLLSQAFSGQQTSTLTTAESSSARVTTPLKLVQTKHSGQQSLTIRSDNKVFATAGWDARVRVYSVATMKELAVLKWHGEGIYAVAFAAVKQDSSEHESIVSDVQAGSAENMQVVKPQTALTFKERRVRKAEAARWLAAGSKDGKVSLWEVF